MESITVANFSKEWKHEVNFIASCYIDARYSFFPFDWRMWVLPSYFSDLTSDILRVRCSLTERFSHFDEIPETSNRVTRANLSRHIPQPLSGSPLARLPFVRFNSAVRLFDFASLDRKCPGDFSCRVYPPSSVCSTYFSSRGDTAFRFGLPRFLGTALFARYNILKNMCHDDETWRRWIFIVAMLYVVSYFYKKVTFLDVKNNILCLSYITCYLHYSFLFFLASYIKTVNCIYIHSD